MFLIGNPERVPGKKANVDEYGGNLTYSAIGLESTGTVANPGIPSAWDATGKVLDVCYEVSTALVVFQYLALIADRSMAM